MGSVRRRSGCGWRLLGLGVRGRKGGDWGVWRGTWRGRGKKWPMGEEGVQLDAEGAD